MGRFTEGWVKLHRHDLGLIGQRYEVMGLWVSLLCMASRYEIKVLMNSRLVSFPPGSVVTSLPELAQSGHQKALSQVRRDLKFLESIGKIHQHSAREGRVISILNWETEEVCNDGETSENGQKIRQITVSSAVEKQQENGRPSLALTVGNNSEKTIINFGAVDSRQESSGTFDPKRQSSGEEEYNNKEELKGENTPSAVSTSLISSVENSGQSIQLGGLLPSVPDQRSPKIPIARKRTADPLLNQHVAKFIGAYVKAYQKRYGDEHRPDTSGMFRGQLQSFLKSFLLEHSIERACDLIQAYCQMDDPWFEKRFHDFQAFAHNLNKIAYALTSGVGSPGSEVDIGRILEKRGLA